ncbi:histidinol-phosphate transaminase [Leucobacter japonicus]|uniref:histidinol-phosphate transaminase n=1 Tax=Leucobacter japonicus TaxID=1461259 RepID=UPI0006A77A2E|nr:histidinol-phosphate transaminase [Leucobacter japonicus]
MSLHRRTSLAAVPPYRQGRPAPAGASKLSSNESPHPPLPSVVAAVAAELDRVQIYPDMGASAVREALAERHGVPVESVTVGAGSVEVASQLIHATAGEGDEVVFAWRSFEAYPSLVRIAGATPVEVPLDAHARHDLDAMLAAITPRTRLIFVCNPNNPTGTVVAAEALRAFVDAVPRDVLVVIDEAYVHFDRTPNRANGLELFREFPHVAVLHTFSKAYGLAGLRIGYAVSPVEIAEELRKVAVPFGVTNLAQAAAVASLAAEEELAARITEVTDQRERLFVALDAWGYDPARSQANFVWVAAGATNGRTPEEIGDLLESGGVIARVFPGEGVRISCGIPSDTDRVLAALAPAGTMSQNAAAQLDAEAVVR